ncbi:MAG: ABC transporter ATP-binding protein/permease [Candidatus Hydrogenedentes bacterium]|nr:ABC transporter ATP-binding protein/permease [Candidatus Hydrogenedentota bacterium]
MHGVDDTGEYNPRHLSDAQGRTWPIYNRLLGYVMRYKFRLATSIVFAFFVAGSFGGVIIGTGTIVKYVFESNDAKVAGDLAHVQKNVSQRADKIDAFIGGKYANRLAGDINGLIATRLAYLRENPMRAMTWVCVLVMSLTILGGIARFLQEYLSASIATFVTIQLGKEMYANIIRLPLKFFEQRTSGEVVARLTNDIFMAGRGLTVVFMKLFREPFKALMFLGIALWQSVSLTLIGLCVLPPVAYVMIKVGQSVRRRARRSLEKVASLQTVAKETVTGISIVKGYSMEDYAIGVVNREYRKLERQGLKMMWADAAIGPLTEIVMMIGFVVFIYISAKQVKDGILELSELAVLYVALAGMLDPIRKITSVNNAVQSSVASAQRAFEFIDMKPEILDAPDAVELKPIKDGIRFDNVQFGYDGKTEVLHGVSFEVKKGEMVAIVGHSGAGKSTVVKLLPRFYDVTGGAIRFDGIDIRKVTQESLRAQIGIVTQEIILFNESVRANITAGRTTYSDDRIRSAAKAAHAEEFIERLPRGYDTPVGESGGLLSGGQRQRLAIARALMKDPSILILDEATSSLDTESERAIQRAIEEFVVGRTSIVIAHRLSTVQRADRIIVLDNGCVVEQGTHHELLQREGSVYRRLYEVQFASEEAAQAESVDATRPVEKATSPAPRVEPDVAY